MSARSKNPLGTWLLAVLALLLLAASCGSSDSEATDDDGGGDDAPSRIVSLSSTATEILFAIGAGDQVVAVDSFSNYPPEAPITDLSAFEASLEAIAALEPDLVVYAFDPGELQAGLEGVGIEAIFQPPAVDLDDAYAQIADLGVATGNEDGAAQVVADIRSQIDEITASLPADGAPIRIYHEVDDTYFSASSNAFLGQLYAMLNTVNIADEADVEGFGFPQLNPEYILEADPQLIVITDEIGYGIEDVASRPGWDAIAAVQSDSIVSVDGDIASRWGPRLPQFLEVIAEALTTVPVPAN